MIELKNIKKTYWMGDNEVQALRDVSLSIESGDYIAIMGPSGSGKSTLMHILGLLDVPSTGSYLIDNKEAATLDQDELAVLRREAVGFIFQQFNLLPRMDLSENVALPLLYSRLKVGSDWISRLITRVGLKERASHKPNELSGGQQQRVAIARALVNQPRMILADEPTGNLDSQSEAEILALLKELNDQGITIVVVTHEEEIAHQAKRLIKMRDGRIVSDERTQTLTQALQIEQRPQVNKKLFNGLFELFDYFRQGFRSLASNKVRTSLSMLGIMIGVSAVVTMLAIGTGAKEAIREQLSTLGSNLLILRPGAVRVGGVTQAIGATTRLSISDVAAIETNVPWVKQSTVEVFGPGNLTFAENNWSTRITGVGASYPTMRDSVPVFGRFFTEQENKTRSRVAVLGATVVKQLFKDRNPIGEMIKINKVSFQIIGILPIKGANTFRDQDDVVIVPALTAMYRLLGKDYVDQIDLEISDESKIEESQEAILSLMHTRYRVPPSQRQGAFEVRNLAEIADAISQTSRVMTILLSLVAAISLLVGGIGIMNIMLVSVTERTKEIGLRKALGARGKDILAQFLAESVVVSVAGGMFGVALAWTASTLIGLLAGWSAPISVTSIVLAVVVSGGVGVIFGVYPARKPSRLHPIDALRFE